MIFLSRLVRQSVIISNPVGPGHGAHRRDRQYSLLIRFNKPTSNNHEINCRTNSPALRSGGSLWIVDLIAHCAPQIEALMWRRYGQYLSGLKDDDYRDQVFAYIEQEDSPRPLMFQLDLLRAVGFDQIEVLHKNSCFAAFGGIKAGAHQP